MEKQAIKGKRQARKLIVQALYQWQMSGHTIAEIEAQFRAVNKMDKIDVDYFCRLLHGIPQRLINLEEQFKPFLDRALTDLNPIELAVLRLGAFELLYCPEVPYRVILDEAISLTKAFGSNDGYRYVNGVLHSLAKQTRQTEMN